jgi:HSP20 family protein
MSNLIRWEPMREMMTLREAMYRLFDDAFTRPVSINNWGMPAIDMYQTDDKVVVKAALPGLGSDDVQISVTGDVLTLKGEFHQDDEVKEATYQLKERR